MQLPFKKNSVDKINTGKDNHLQGVLILLET